MMWNASFAHYIFNSMMLNQNFTCQLFHGDLQVLSYTSEIFWIITTSSFFFFFFFFFFLISLSSGHTSEVYRSRDGRRRPLSGTPFRFYRGTASSCISVPLSSRFSPIWHDSPVEASQSARPPAGWGTVPPPCLYCGDGPRRTAQLFFARHLFGEDVPAQLLPQLEGSFSRDLFGGESANDIYRLREGNTAGDRAAAALATADGYSGDALYRFRDRLLPYHVNVLTSTGTRNRASRILKDANNGKTTFMDREGCPLANNRRYHIRQLQTNMLKYYLKLD